MRPSVSSVFVFSRIPAVSIQLSVIPRPCIVFRLHQVERLADLEEFQRHKEQLRSKMETMEKQLVSQEEEHQAALHRLEIDVLMEKERLDPLTY